MTGATGFKSAGVNIFNMFKGGGALAELHKEYGKSSGLTAGNKDFNKLQRGGSIAAPSHRSGVAKSVRSGGSARTNRTTRSYSKSRMSRKDPYENADPEFFDGLIEVAENEMTNDFNLIKAIKK